MKNRFSKIAVTSILVSLCLVLYSVSWGNIFYCIDPGHGGDVNCDGNVDILDTVYLTNFKYKGGPDPCPCN